MEHTKLEKQEILAQIKKENHQKYLNGKKIVTAICISNIIIAIVSLGINFNFISLIISIGLTIGLYFGISWVRYFFAINAVSALFYATTILTSGQNLGLPVTMFCIISAVYCTAIAICLFINESVSDFLYSQINF